MLQPACTWCHAGGTVTRCDPPHGFDATWEMGGDMSNVDDQRWARFGPGAVGVGWDSGLIGLYLHLTSRRAVDRGRAAEWSASQEGLRFLTASSDAWYEASVAFGTDPAAARAAAGRTTAFYTAAPEPGAGVGQHG